MRSPSRFGTHRSSPAAVTLIELLVVVAILVVLIALLFPALNIVRASADSAGCVSNLRQVGFAIQAFASDNAGSLPEAVFTRQGPAYNRDQRRIQNPLLPYLNLQPSTTWSTAPENLSYAKVLECPAWKRKNPASTLAKFPFAINRAVPLPEGTFVKPFGDGDGSGSGNPNPRPLKISALLDTGLSRIWAIRDFEDQTPAPNHGTYRNALFFDWHVGRLDLNNNPL